MIILTVHLVKTFSGRMTVMMAEKEKQEKIRKSRIRRERDFQGWFYINSGYNRAHLWETCITMCNTVLYNKDIQYNFY